MKTFANNCYVLYAYNISYFAYKKFYPRLWCNTLSVIVEIQSFLPCLNGHALGCYKPRFEVWIEYKKFTYCHHQLAVFYVCGHACKLLTYTHNEKHPRNTYFLIQLFIIFNLQLHINLRRYPVYCLLPQSPPPPLFL